MPLTGNKGEWSELYTFVKLLESGRLYAADENTNRLNNVYLPILGIEREEEAGRRIDYTINSETGVVDIWWGNERINSISNRRISAYADYLYREIINGSNRAFPIDGADEIMQDLRCYKLAAPATDKTDITMQLHDIYTGFNPVCGFSIKSELGNPPTLLNASKATNFIYEVHGLSQWDMERINAIDTRNKILDRIEAICNIGTMTYAGMNNDTFRYNLLLVDGCMEKIIADMLFYSYRYNENSCQKALQYVIRDNPFRVPDQNFYRIKFKRFLYSVALGMMPSKKWDGRDEANGGYIIVKENGDVVTYHTHNRNYFEDYLYANTRFERASTSRHEFASLYMVNGRMYINLNLQIRFK